MMGATTMPRVYDTVKVGTKGAQTKAAQCLIRRSKRPVRADGSFSAADAAQLIPVL